MNDGSPAAPSASRCELILGGQRSGKSARAEQLAAAWLDSAPERRAVLIATAQANDAEMRARIERHREDRARRIPRMRTVEEPLHLSEALRAHAAPDTLVLVDCLTLWITNLLMPMQGSAAATTGAEEAQVALIAAMAEAPGPLVFVSNEIGLGVIPMGRETRDFVDALGRLHQAVARSCDRVTFMAAGLPLVLKGGT